ncbi:hypothetical protein AGMMS49925_05440 [Deltaproteobacteria bacterium]|nr:hypothetical protein AGMMS49925_05440 [Deltaproteobacteria bacterium]
MQIREHAAVKLSIGLRNAAMRGEDRAFAVLQRWVIALGLCTVKKVDAQAM